ncbi:MAG: DUF2089 domain-containing protein [Actinobacteria bacterium]|nr:DUF2089 domain-containing protein [Actinomycetota bacterium]
MADRQPPQNCPVCGDRLAITRLGCDECGTELSGAFAGCAFCGLGVEDREILWVFLASRGNIKEVERHLGVSYPTARARVDAMLESLGVEPVGASDRDRRAADREKVLEALAKGEMDIDQAEEALRG